MENKKTIRDEETKTTLKNRLARIKGQINGIETMIDEDRYCEDIIIQLLASSKALRSIASLMLEKHLHSCITKAIKEGDTSIIDEIQTLIDRYSDR